MTGLLVQSVATAPTFDWAQFLGTSGPLAGAGLLFGYLFKIWTDSRKEKREDKKAGLEGEVGAVAAARDAVSLVRAQMNEMRAEITEMKAVIEEYRRNTDKLERRVRELESERSFLESQLQKERGDTREGL